MTKRYDALIIGGGQLSRYLASMAVMLASDRSSIIRISARPSGASTSDAASMMIFSRMRAISSLVENGLLR